MLWSDLIRFGGVAAGVPATAAVYHQLWADYCVGRKARPAADFARLTGLGVKQVGRVFDRLVEWGLVAKQTKPQRLVIGTWPNRAFCRDVVVGLYGLDAVQRLDSGTLAAELCPTSGQGDPVCNYAVQSLVALYGRLGLYSTPLPMPSEAAGQGYVVFAEVDIKGVDMRSVTLSLGSLWLEPKGYNSSRADVHSGSTGPRADVHLDEYQLDLSTMVNVEKPVKQQVRAARAKRYETIPATSSGFVYWPNDRLPLDSEYYPTVVALLDYWNDVAGTGERLSWKLYIGVRSLLVEEALDPEDLQRAFRELANDPFWAGKLSLYKLSNNVHLVREVLIKRRGDRFARSMPAQPQGDMQVYSF